MFVLRLASADLRLWLFPRTRAKGSRGRCRSSPRCFPPVTFPPTPPRTALISLPTATTPASLLSTVRSRLATPPDTLVRLPNCRLLCTPDQLLPSTTVPHQAATPPTRLPPTPPTCPASLPATLPAILQPTLSPRATLLTTARAT